MKLRDMGTTGLVQYATESWVMRGCRMAQAARVIADRQGAVGVERFRLAVNAEWHRQAGYLITAPPNNATYQLNLTGISR